MHGLGGSSSKGMWLLSRLHDTFHGGHTGLTCLPARGITDKG